MDALQNDYERDDFDKLENLLQQWVDEVRRECILRGFGILRDYRFTACWSEVSQHIEANPDKPVSNTLDFIENRLDEALTIVLNEHGMLVGGTIALKTSMLEGLMILQDVDDYDSVISISSESVDPIQTMAELLGFATVKPWAEYIDHLIRVPQRLIDKIVSLYSSRVNNAGEDLTLFESNDKDKALRLRQFTDKYPQTLVVTSLLNMRPLGTPMNILLNDFKLPLGALEPMAPDQAALELMGLGLLGDIPFNDFPNKLKRFVDTVYINIDFITKVDVRLDQLIAETIHGQT